MKKSLLALASGTLGLGIAEFVMMGILPNVAHDLGVSIPTAGHFISAYAIGVCVGAPLMVVVARTRPLKQILLGLVAVYFVGNLCAAFSQGYWSLLLMRFVSGLPHGAFFGVGSIVAERVADKGKESLAVSMMIAGMTVAVVSIPLALALAIASGVSPAQGLYTAIVAGFFIALLGGSRYQIGGPTGAFVIIIYGIIATSAAIHELFSDV